MLEIVDTGGGDDYEALRDQWIRDGDAFVLVYSISSRSSFIRIHSLHDQIQNIKALSERSLSYTGSTTCTSASPSPVPILIVGNMSDRVTDREVSVHEGQCLSQNLGCSFEEASAKSGIGVENAFYEISRQLQRRHNQSNVGQIQKTREWPRTGISDGGSFGHGRVSKFEKDKSKCTIL
jgi:GTPase KRas protein